MVGFIAGMAEIIGKNGFAKNCQQTFARLFVRNINK